MSRPREWAVFVFLGVLAWGTSFLWIKIALRELGPLSVVMYRMAFGVLGAWLITAALKKPLPLTRRQVLTLLLLGVVNTAVPVALITWAETRIDSGLAGMLNGTMPLFTILFAHFILPEDRFTLPKVAGLAAGFLGLLILMLRDIGPAELTGSIWGQLAVVLAAIFYAGSSVYVRLKLKGQHPVHTAAVSLTSASARDDHPRSAVRSADGPAAPAHDVARRGVDGLCRPLACVLRVFLPHSGVGRNAFGRGDVCFSRGGGDAGGDFSWRAAELALICRWRADYWRHCAGERPEATDGLEYFTRGDIPLEVQKAYARPHRLSCLELSRICIYKHKLMINFIPLDLRGKIFVT